MSRDCCDPSGGPAKSLSANSICGRNGSFCRLAANNLIVNNITNAATNQIIPPFAGAPGFCSSIEQYVNGAWGIYRSPGITEITVGNGGDSVAPGSNFTTVADALAALTGDGNCRAIRITDSFSEPGPISTPPNTLIYIDPGVIWTIDMGGGPAPVSAIQMQGDLVILGNLAQNSSTLSIQNLGGDPNNPAVAITGPDGSHLEIRNLHLDHSVGVYDFAQLFGSSGFAQAQEMYLFNVRITLGNARGLVYSDGKPFPAIEHMQWTDVTIEGGGPQCWECLSFFNQQADLRFHVTNLAITGEWSSSDSEPIITSATRRLQWNGVYFNIDQNLAFCELSGSISDVVVGDRETAVPVNTEITLICPGEGTIVNNVRGIWNISVRNISQIYSNIWIYDEFGVLAAGNNINVDNMGCGRINTRASSGRYNNCLLRGLNNVNGSFLLVAGNAEFTQISNCRLTVLNANIDVNGNPNVVVSNCIIGPNGGGGTGTVETPNNVAATITLIANCKTDGAVPGTGMVSNCAQF